MGGLEIFNGKKIFKRGKFFNDVKFKNQKKISKSDLSKEWTLKFFQLLKVLQNFL